MTPGSYERFGLTSNPFRDLASESVEDIEMFHVNQQLDDTLRAIEEEVLEKENRAMVALLGGHGAGKTERLLLANAEARRRGAFSVYHDITAKTPWILRGLAAEFQRSARSAGLVRAFSSPSWFRPMGRLLKIKDQKYDPLKAGKVIAKALNESAPSFLLLNDFHNMSQSSEVDTFTRTLQEIGDSIRQGVLVMFCSYPNYFQAVTRSRPAFGSRINRTFTLPTFGADEAALLLAKKLLAKRLAEDVDPLYPFDKESVAVLNEAAVGNPRRLLELADLTIEYATDHRLYRVDADVARAVLAARTPAPSISARPFAAPVANPTQPRVSTPPARIPAAGGVLGK
jgi:hypothetical protein